MKHIFSACPHDVANDPEKWTEFADYFKKKQVFATEFLRYLSFEEFSQNFQKFNFVYAHPLDAVKLKNDHGFIPLAKYTETYDEAAIIAAKSIASPSIEKIKDQRVACVNGTPSLAALLIDLHKNHQGIEFDPVYRTTYPDVLMAVSIGDAQYGVILKSVWDEMITMKERVNHFYTTATRTLVHVFLVSPEMKPIAESLRRALFSMHQDPEGKKILERLKCGSIESFNDNDLTELGNTLKVCNF